MSEGRFKAMSMEEYLRTEATSPYKREYVGGFVYPLHGQAGASRSHSLISMNIAATLHPHARRQGCRLHLADMRLYLDSSGSYYYPDVMLVCDAASGDHLSETAPCLLVEVLSGSTASIDRIGKYGIYTDLPSLQTSLIVEQGERRVYEYQRAQGWKLREVVGSGEVGVPSLGLGLTLDDIYGGVL
ncbi:Uma2 family endonuclease [Deinococcus koreensis]|uniref:Uma2 family endonuclease n=1 Tax=Deinococcus koreensis TaxID=2054903 RepID=A0A2K3UXY1_9DEIO|nr:Uma2 family endonuclease [Deinococcus koreensis]PNY81389.1 Uma2 family endonuclease [Deinococcus koreensis]